MTSAGPAPLESAREGGFGAAPTAFGGGSTPVRSLLGVRLATSPDPAKLERPLTDLRGVGPKLAAAAARIGLHTFADLIEHYPHDYGDRSSATEIAVLRIGEQATVVAEVRTARLRPTRRRNLNIVEATVADGSASMKVTWFNQAWLADRLKPGVRLLLSGRLDGGGFRPDAYEILAAHSPESGGSDPIRDQPGPPSGLHTTGIVPIHPSGEGLRVQKIREWVWSALAQARDVSSRFRPRSGPAGATRGRPMLASRLISR